MNLADFKDLLTPLGQDALAEVTERQPKEADFLAHYQQLQRAYPDGIAKAALETAILRLEAGSKFPFAEKMYLTRESLQQATAYPVSAYRAQRYRGCQRVLDFGCSIGGDTIALAELAPTTGVDLEPLRLAMALQNLRNLGRAANFVRADLMGKLPFASPGTAIFFDPARRIDHRRVHNVEGYRPPLSIVNGWLPQYPNIGVKISPGVDLTEISGYPAEVEFISLGGDLKEAVLWFGDFRACGKRATLLPGEHTLVDDDVPPSEVREPSSYLYEPDPAVLRAGLVTSLGVRLDAYQLDEDIAYLTGERLVATPFARAWRIRDWLPFQLKRLRAYLRERNIGSVTVKKRGSPIQPEELIRSLKLQGEESCVVVLTQLQGKPVVLICEEIR